MSDIGPLIERFIDDRDALNDAELERLVAALQDSPELLSSLKDQLLLDEALSQQQGVDRRNFPAQIAQRLRDAARDEDELLSQVDEMRSLAVQQYEPTHRRRRRPFLRLVTAAVLMIAAFAGGAWYVLPGINDRPEVVRVFGEATLFRDGIATRIIAGKSERLRYSDLLATAPKAFVVLEYPDGTRVNVASESLVECVTRFRSGKILRVERGAVGSSVARQPGGRPMRFRTSNADAKVVGTELLLEVTGDATRLSVAEGKVELKGLTSRYGVEISAQQVGTCDGQKVHVEPLIWPASRQGLQVVMEPRQEQPPAAWELRGNAQWGTAEGLRFRGGSAVVPVAESDQLIDACRSTNQLSVEVLLRSDAPHSDRTARIVSLATDPFSRNFTLAQERGSLLFRLRTPESETENNGEVRLCKIEDRHTHHVVVTYEGGRLKCYLDGEQVATIDQIQGDFSNWTSHYLALADEWKSGAATAWRGEIHALAVYNRALGSDEVLRNAASLRPFRD